MPHPSIVVTLSAGPDAAAAAVVLSFVNVSGEKAYLYKPNACEGGKLENNVFVIQDETAPVRYRGVYTKRPAPEAADYLVIEPNDRYVTGVRLGDYYAFPRGDHTCSVRYEAYHGHPEDRDAFWELTSNDIEIRTAFQQQS